MRAGTGRAPAGRPLAGRRIAVTRPRGQAGPLIARLEELGAEVIPLPVIRIEPPSDRERLDRAVREAPAFDWIVFTSANGVEAFGERLAALGVDRSSLAGARLAAVGPATAERLAELGFSAHLVPEEHRAEGLLEALLRAGVGGRSVLLLRSEQGRELLAEGLRKHGASVLAVAAYRTAPARPDPGALAALREGTVDAWVFTSSSTVQHLARLFADEGIPWPPRGEVVCIGPPTAEAARRAGLSVSAVARAATGEGLVERLLERFAPAAGRDSSSPGGRS